MSSLETTLLIAAPGVALGLLGWWARAVSKRRQAAAEVERRLLSAPANGKVLVGVKSLLREWRVETAKALTVWTAADTRHMRNTIGQLYHPADELFPLLKHPLPLPCQYKVHSCPALVHPQTGALFGIRISTYLCLLRLSGPACREAVENGAVWPQHPAPHLKKYDLAELFGADWVVPNSAHAAIARYYQAAFEQASAAAPADEGQGRAGERGDT